MCLAADDYRRYRKMPIDNLPPPSLKDREDSARFIVDKLSRVDQLVTLKYLYPVCNCKIDDLGREIGKAMKAESEEKTR